MTLNFKKEQTALREIVKTWKISEDPEYRGFRCAYCQKYINEAWYHWLNTEDFRIPVHLCDTCESALQNSEIDIPQTNSTQINIQTFENPVIPPETVKRFKEIIKLWPEKSAPNLKVFFCDNCGMELNIEADGKRTGYHVWWKTENGKTLAELHFHKECAKRLHIADLK